MLLILGLNMGPPGRQILKSETLDQGSPNLKTSLPSIQYYVNN